MGKMNWRGRVTQRRILGLLIAAATGWVSTILYPASPRDQFIKQPFVGAERIGLDTLFAVRGPRDDRIDPNIAIVGFTKRSEDALKTRWPVPRRMHAQLIDRLNADGAKLIVFDALFSGATKVEDDRALDAALKKAKNVVLTQRMDRDTIQRQKSIEYVYYDDALGIDFESDAALGLAEVALDGDDVVRTFVPAMKSQGEWLPTLATAAYLKLIDKSPKAIRIDADSMQLGDKEFFQIFSHTKDSVDGSLIVSLLVDYPSGIDAFFSTYSYEQVLNGKFPKGSYKNKIVFVGVTGFEQAKELDDLYTISSTQLAIQSGDAGADNTRAADFGRIPGVFIQAHFLNALTMNSFLTLVERWHQGVIVFLFTIVGIDVARRYVNWRGPLFVIGLAVAYFGLSLGMFEYGQVHLPFVVPLMLFFVSVGSISWLERAGLKKRWAGYVSVDVLEHILKSDFDNVAKRHDAIVMFGDIRGFTAFSDKHDPELVVTLLNRHFEKFTDAIFAEKGAIDKFMGDGVIVVFGAPIKLENAALRAVRAGLKMRDASMIPFTENGEEHVFATGFGIASGPFVAGHVGSRRRHDYTVIGDVVNTASRLQGITGQPDVVIDEATYRQVENDVEVESLGPVALKGKAVPVTCYKVLRLKSNQQ